MFFCILWIAQENIRLAREIRPRTTASGMSARGAHAESTNKERDKGERAETAQHAQPLYK